MRNFFLIIVSAILFSCEKKELPAPKYERGDVLTRQIEMTTNYKNQVWFLLSDNKVVSTNFKTDWDIAFEASSAGNKVVLNASLGMRAYKTNFSQLSQVVDTVGSGAGEKVDAPTGNLDSTAIGDWQSDNKVYVLNRGYNELGQMLGFYKLKIISVSASGFTFEYGDLYGSQTFQGSVSKDDQYNFIAYSFNTNQQVSIEPKKTEYDLCFTQFTHIFTNPVMFYQVAGVLSNTYNTRVTIVKDRPFNEITVNDTLGRSFSSFKNSVGYDWKVYDLNTSVYTVNTSLCYIINDSKGFYYKLHFIDFYNSSGIKGYPTFEFKKL